MDAIILAGGFATRLRPLTLTIPKPLLPILGKPLLEWIYEDLLKENISKIILSLHNMADKIIDHYNKRFPNAPITHLLEDKPLGDGGSLLNTLENLGESVNYPVIVLYGDIFTRMSYRDLYNFHARNGGIATIVGVYVNDVSRYGLLQVSERDILKKIIEKPRDYLERKGLVNAGIYVFSREILDLVKSLRSEKLKKEKISIAKDIIPMLINKGDVYVYKYEGVWSDIGTPIDYFRANIEALRSILNTALHIDQSAKIDPEARIEGPAYIGENVEIHRDSYIGENVIIMNNVEIGEGVYIENSLIMSSTTIKDHSFIRGSIIGESNVIGRWVRIYDGSILGSSIYVHDRVCIPSKTLILPHKEISDDHCEKKFSKISLQETENNIII